ncbi:hypothetical protein M378DRAFT_27965 [Amanita muscaria Koide BX008]|uniref:Alpha-type protein kinase domain-containing protein n=1 Tax=Amanita muscaria (strain Koide BX008) TaxID=946122 RepID=A0A0C2WLB5_AMAMK|nr:hypothetical protein M378DRAFT_27965 [Amanita muscaria Koide BX008]
MSEPSSSHYAADFTSTGAAKEGPLKTWSRSMPPVLSILPQQEWHHTSQQWRDITGQALSKLLTQRSQEHSPSPTRFNGVQAIGGTRSNQGPDAGHLTGATPGYVMNSSSGPLQTPGPSIHLPGRIPQYTGPPPMHSQPGRGPQSVGYTHVHATYPAVRHERIQQAYSTYNGEVVVVEVRMVLKPAGFVQEKIIHDLIEAVDHIPVHIGAAALKRLLYEAVIPKWNAWTNNYPLHVDGVIMRDKLWVELKPNNPDCDVIAKYFFKIGRKGVQTFKTGKTVIYFHVPNEIYDTMVETREANELAAEKKAKPLVKSESSAWVDFTTAVDKGKKRARSPSPILQRDQSSDHDSDIEIMKSITHHTKRRKDIGHLRNTEPAPRHGSDTWNTSIQRGFTTPKSRPPSPSAEHISQALKTQRLPTNKEMSPFLCLTTFNVVVYPVEHRTWAQLLDQPEKPAQISVGKQENNFYLGKPLTSVLQLDLAASNTKKGGFKLAVFGTSIAGIFKGEDVEAICAKRVYQPIEKLVEVNGALKTKVINVPHEGQKQFQHLTMEVSCLVWAQALLDMVYDFIKEMTVTRDPKNLPFHIPQLRFVKAAIAIEQSQSQTAGKKTTFLLEEVIDVNTEGPFRKYLNNVSPEPLVMETKDDEVRAKFLAFSQHVQYWKTKKQVFVSDYQGGSTLLTDPQISSAGALGPIFADGNIPSAHHSFERKHRCNYFCQWFNLQTSNYDEGA